MVMRKLIILIIGLIIMTGLSLIEDYKNSTQDNSYISIEANEDK